MVEGASYRALLLSKGCLKVLQRVERACARRAPGDPLAIVLGSTPKRITKCTRAHMPVEQRSRGKSSVHACTGYLHAPAVLRPPADGLRVLVAVALACPIRAAAARWQHLLALLGIAVKETHANHTHA